MLTTKKLAAPFSALILACLVLVLLNGCTDPGPRALLQGERLVREGNYVEAIAKLERASKFLPRDARAWNHLGVAYHGGGRIADAAKAYQQALALDRNLAAGHFNLGCLHLEQNNLPAALAELTSYTGLRPNEADGWTRLGTAQLRARQLDAAEKSFRQALKLNSRSVEAWNRLGLVQMQRRHYQEAYQQFDAALRVQPDYAPALLNAAIVLHQYLNGHAPALQRYRQFLALQPPSPHSAAVRQIVNQLDLELHPSSRAAPSNPPPQLASMAPTPSLAKPPSPDFGTNKSWAVSPHPLAGPAAPHANALSPPAIRPAPPTSSPPAAIENPPAPAPTIEIVRLTEDEPIRAARDIALDSASGGSETTTPGPAATNAAAPATDAATTARPKNGFVSRLNPRNWFRSTENAPPATSAARGESLAVAETNRAQTVAAASAAVPSPPRAIARYRYRSPSAPRPGDRSQAERRFAQGVRAQERNRLSEAIEEYRQATIADPSFGDAYYNLGVAAYEAGDLAQCLSAYEYALAMNPAAPKARFNFAMALQKANYPRDAAVELERLLADNATEARAHFMLANLCAQQLGEPVRAREHYLRLLELEPQHPQATAIRYWLEANP